MSARDRRLTKRYIVMKDYGSYEGWSVQAECDTWAEAIEAHRQALEDGGGPTEVFERIDVWAALQGLNGQIRAGATPALPHQTEAPE
jgi:hypothetical protein